MNILKQEYFNVKAICGCLLGVFAEQCTISTFTFVHCALGGTRCRYGDLWSF